MANSKERTTVVYVERKPDRTLLWFLLFGWWYPLVLLVRWSVRTTVRLVTWPLRAGAWLGWKTLFAWPWRMAVAGTRWTIAGTRKAYPYARKAWPYAVAGGRSFQARFGARGWAIAAAIIVVLAILGTLTTHP